MANGDERGYIVTDRGDIAEYRVAQEGMYIATYLSDAPPPPVPSWLVPVLQVRALIYDPMAKELVFVTKMPQYPPVGIAFTRGYGEYRVKRNGEWEELPSKFTDRFIAAAVQASGGNALKAAITLINRLIARIQPDDYITSGNAGGQTVSFPSLESMLAYYRGLKDELQAEAALLAGNDTGRFMYFERPAVGGVYED